MVSIFHEHLVRLEVPSLAVCSILGYCIAVEYFPLIRSNADRVKSSMLVHVWGSSWDFEKGEQNSDKVTDLLSEGIWPESKWKDESKSQLMETENKLKVHKEELANLPGAQLCYDCTLKPWNLIAWACAAMPFLIAVRSQASFFFLKLSFLI